MPELPEVETVSRGLRRLLAGREITRVVCRRMRLRYPLDEAGLNDVLAGKQPIRIVRRAKYMVWETGRAAVLVHLGMSGRFRRIESKAPLGKHEHIQFCLDDGYDLRYQDPRRFGIVLPVVDGDWRQHSLISALGPEPLPELDPKHMARKAAGRRISVKQFILDQTVVAGIGNIYASEALFFAGIHPQTNVSKIGARRWRRLASAISQVLERAIKAGGTTLDDGMFSDVDGNAGYFDIELQAYGRRGKPCEKCNRTIEAVVVAGRSTFFCPRCQR